MNNVKHKETNYKGFSINRITSNGFYEVYLKDRFIKADTLTGIKCIIDEFKLKNNKK